MSLDIIILAAGKGKRMRSSLPKVLHPIGGRPLLVHLLETAARLKPNRLHVVVGHARDEVVSGISKALSNKPKVLELIRWVEQKEQRGTGHAVQQALPRIKAGATVLVLNGDVPLLSVQTLRKVANAGDGMKLLTVELDDPTGLGRIVRDQRQRITGIVEEKDATPVQRRILEVNTNCLAMSCSKLRKMLNRIRDDNAQGEFYLTDVLGEAVKAGIAVKTVSTADPDEVLGVNSKAELARLERRYQQNQAQALLDRGVMLMDPARIDVRGTCTFGNDCLVDVNAIFEGEVKVGNGVRIGPNCLIRDSIIGDDCVIEANSVIDSARLSAGCSIGPFARIRPGTNLAEQARIGNFVEIKKSDIGRGSKVNHLAYVGDSEVGREVNIGAGVITCNYDGANKHKTVIEDGVFVGSDSQLVAPVHVGRNATIGAGSTITDDVKDGSLAVSRARQRGIGNWKRPVKKPK